MQRPKMWNTVNPRALDGPFIIFLLLYSLYPSNYEFGVFSRRSLSMNWIREFLMDRLGPFDRYFSFFFFCLPALVRYDGILGERVTIKADGHVACSANESTAKCLVKYRPIILY